MPFIANPFSFVEVTEDHVRWQHGFNDRFNLPLESVRARHDPTGWFWGQLLGTGDVVIAEATEHRIPNVLRGRALRKRITNQRSLKEESQERLCASEAERTSLTEFEDFAVCLPVIPNGVFFVLRHAMDAFPCGAEYLVNVGSVVIRGDELAHFREKSEDSRNGYRVKVVAPFAGKVVYKGFAAFSQLWDAKNGWPEFHNASNNIMIALQPAKGQSLTRATAIAYSDLIEFVGKELNGYRDTDVVKTVRQELAWLCEAKEKITSTDIETSWKDLWNQYLAARQSASQ